MIFNTKFNKNWKENLLKETKFVKLEMQMISFFSRKLYNELIFKFTIQCFVTQGDEKLTL